MKRRFDAVRCIFFFLHSLDNVTALFGIFDPRSKAVCDVNVALRVHPASDT